MSATPNFGYKIEHTNHNGYCINCNQWIPAVSSFCYRCFYKCKLCRLFFVRTNLMITLEGDMDTPNGTLVHYTKMTHKINEICKPCAVLYDQREGKDTEKKIVVRQMRTADGKTIAEVTLE